MKAYAQQFGSEPSQPFYAAEAYDGTRIVLNLIKQCGQDTACARTKLLTRAWDGITGNLQFNEQGDVSQQTSIVRIVHGTTVYES